MISIIAAMDEKRGIGKNGVLPWYIPEDFKRMKELTMGHPLVMGRKTFESLGRLLPGRTHVVITSDPNSLNQLNYKPDVVVFSLEEGIEEAKKSPGNGEIFIFGGGGVFKEAIEKNLVDKLYLTQVKGDFNADTYFPEYSEFKKILSKQEGESEGLKFKFVDLSK